MPMGARLGRHLQPEAGDYFSLRGSVAGARERYGYYDDGLRHGAL